MGRPKKIWRRSVGGHWYTTEGNRKVKVADGSLSYRDAFEKFRSASEQPTGGGLEVKRLAAAFLKYCERNRSHSTYAWYRSFLNPFSESVGSLRVSDAKNHHLQRWLDSTEWNENSRNGAVRAVLRCLNWGVQQGHISANPFLGIERPTRTPREVVINDQQFAELLRRVRPEFADYLTFLHETGCRPQEIRLLTPQHWDGEKFILERRNSKGRKYQRVVYCNAKARQIVLRLLRNVSSNSPLFLNADGKPWTANAVRCRFRRLSKTWTLPGLCATTLRHSFCTSALKRGVDSTTVALLMGHRDTAMVARVYQHLAKDHAYLATAAERATAG